MFITKSEKRAIRLSIIQLLDSERINGESTQENDEIRQLGELLDNPTLNTETSTAQKLLRPADLTLGAYIFLVNEGFNQGAIREIFGIGKNKLLKWREKNGIKKIGHIDIATYPDSVSEEADQFKEIYIKHIKDFTHMLK
ncbi:MAG: hypothetical protein ACK5NA_01820 [Enterococcus sp.]